MTPFTRPFRVFALLALCLLLALCASVTSAQTSDDALVVFTSGWLIGPASVDAYVNGDLFASAINGNDAYSVNMPAGTYSVTMTRGGQGVDNALFKPVAATFVAGHAYLVAAFGNLDAGTQQLQSFDLGQTAQPGESRPMRAAIFNQLTSGQSVDFWVNDTVLSSALATGSSTFVDLPVQSLPYGEAFSLTGTGQQGQGTRIALHWIPKPTSAETPVRDNLLVAYLLWGKFPGTRYLDYSVPSHYLYDGILKMVSGGEIQIGGSADIQINRGERHQYTLNVAQSMALDIRLIGAPSADGQRTDAYLYLYDKNAKLLMRNDEITLDDQTGDAGFVGVKLDPGTYTLIAAGYGDDIPTGSYTLSVGSSG